MKSTQLADALLFAEETDLSGSTINKAGKIDAILIQYNHGTLPGQQPDAECDYLQDEAYWPCYETAIAEGAAELLEAYQIGPSALWSKMLELMAEETESQLEQDNEV